jgi:hypothetical protein
MSSKQWKNTKLQKAITFDLGVEMRQILYRRKALEETKIMGLLKMENYENQKSLKIGNQKQTYAIF